MATQEDVDIYVAELREMADFLVKHGTKLPDLYISTYEWLNLTATDYDSDTGETKINDAKTKQNIKAFLDAVGECEKDYREDEIKITKRYKSTGNRMFVGSVDRNIACKRVVIGQKVIPAVPEKIVDETEWVCAENMSLLKLVQ